MPTVKIQRKEKGVFQRNYSLKNTPAGGYMSCSIHVGETPCKCKVFRDRSTKGPHREI